MDDQITQLDRRLTAVERDVAAFTAEARAHHATREDLARIEERIAAIQSNYATKADLAALECKFSQAENRMMRWCVGTMITLTGVFMAFVKFAV